MKLGTVVVTGANGQVGHALLPVLQEQWDVIALVRSPVSLPVMEVIPDWIHSSSTQGAIAQADAVVHLAGSLKPKNGDYVGANVQTTAAVRSALNPEKNQRVVFLSYVGASEQSSNAYLSTKAQAERLLLASSNPVTIFRCTHIIGSPEHPGSTAESLISKHGKAVSVLGSGQQQVAPVCLDDVVSAILAALNQPQAGIFELAGPNCLSMDALVVLLNANPAVQINHLPPWLARKLPWVLRDLPTALVEVMMADSLGNSDAAIATFGLQLTALRQIWASMPSL